MDKREILTRTVLNKKALGLYEVQGIIPIPADGNYTEADAAAIEAAAGLRRGLFTFEQLRAIRTAPTQAQAILREYLRTVRRLRDADLQRLEVLQTNRRIVTENPAEALTHAYLPELIKAAASALDTHDPMDLPVLWKHFARPVRGMALPKSDLRGKPDDGAVEYSDLTGQGDVKVRNWSGVHFVSAKSNYLPRGKAGILLLILIFLIVIGIVCLTVFAQQQWR